MASNLRICVTTMEYPPDVGGAGRSAQRLVRGLTHDGFDVCVFKPLTERDDPSSFPKEMDGARVHAVPLT